MIEAVGGTFQRDEPTGDASCMVSIRDDGDRAVFVGVTFQSGCETVEFTFDYMDAEALADELADRAAEVRAILDTEEEVGE